MTKGVSPLSQGERIRQARTQKEWTQVQLANKVGVAATTVQNWEAGRKPAGRKNLRLVAKALDVQLAWLDGEEEAVSSLSWPALIGREVTLYFTNRIVAGRLAGAENSGLLISDAVVSFPDDSGRSLTPEDVFFFAFGDFLCQIHGGFNAR